MSHVGTERWALSKYQHYRRFYCIYHPKGPAVAYMRTSKAKALGILNVVESDGTGV